ncbi:hypothetical protein AVEN_44367-1 [Araneus ventricosus]|uniref:Nose resistant-to-fluoxetine protein N-terminal domain-containing protein n=1 Tax=Araneus ventricosus TaxID=182803 RepID=A0A4Y2IXE7_ARAVE|nr:hypothetical protein AVEN_44367-1 [Araneus ventricosus]
MKLVIHKIVIFLAFNIYSAFAVTCENGENEDSFHNYDLLKFIKKSAEHINTSKNLKLLSKKDKEFLNEFEKFLPVSVNSTLLEMLSEASSNKCVEDLKYVFENLLSPGGWAMKMLDSYGKPGSGILLGNINWLGEYDECVSIHAPSKENTNVGDFRGKYCTLQIPLKLGLFDMFHICPFHVDSQNSILRSGSSPVGCCNICSLYGCPSLANKLHMALLWMIPICAQRRRPPGHRC